MSGVGIALAGALLAIPSLVAFGIVYRISGGRKPAAIGAAAVVGAALGSFFASAGSAMATSVEPGEAALRGATIGLVLGGACGGLAAAALSVRARHS